MPPTPGTTSHSPSRLAVRAARRRVDARFEQVAIDRWRATLPPPPGRLELKLPALPRRPGDLLAFFRFVYGGGPLQLLALLGCFAVTGYAVNLAALGPLPERMGVWFVACFLGHDLVLFPLYALADRSLGEIASRLPRRRPRPVTVTEHAAAVNAVRVPAFLSLLLLLVFQGPIRHQGDIFFYNASAHHEADYFARWLLTAGVLFLASALWYAARAGGRRRLDAPLAAGAQARPDTPADGRGADQPGRVPR